MGIGVFHQIEKNFLEYTLTLKSIHMNLTNIECSIILKKICAILLFTCLILLVISCSRTKIQKEPVIKLNVKTGRLYSPKANVTFADGPYHYSIAGSISDKESFRDSILKNKQIREDGNKTIITGKFYEANIEISQVFRQMGNHIEETITLTNINNDTVNLDDIRFGFIADISDRPDWRLCAVPFRVQLDGSKHDYSTEDLKKGQYKNAGFWKEAVKFCQQKKAFLPGKRRWNTGGWAVR
ncbi:hypothetical protein AKJ55_00350 [candidate division MSBL1 archaeon SCGC-AAA382M17]|uniref:Sulfatase-modifying factor enzyme domain-containing protein n=1 Tax=candidate division MSBL1 archaeon SCGC-AAA382M17 TaxID=1698284 RepID=A0ABR5TJY2_9EURY|nr:hypothetical protein AKJ55_00350 [candidate division MSBL1 archaeon SCGC-AAA382M17]